MTLTRFSPLLKDSVGGPASQALHTRYVLLQVRAYLHIDETWYTVLTSADKDVTPLDLADHWQELPHLNNLEEYFEKLTEQLSIAVPSKQLALTQADLVQPAPHHDAACLALTMDHYPVSTVMRRIVNSPLNSAHSPIDNHPSSFSVIAPAVVTAENDHTLLCLVKCDTASTHTWSICRTRICCMALSLCIMPCSAFDGHAGEYCHMCGRAAGVQHSHAVPSTQRPFHLRQAGQVKR